MSEIYTVGFDGSAESRRALMWAAAEAELSGATVRAVSCYTVPPVPGPWVPAVPYDAKTIRDATSNDLGTAVQSARLYHPSVTFEERVVYGAPRAQLVAEAADSTLLVVGSSGAGAGESWLLGSVAHSAARTSDCPVVIVPATSSHDPSGRIVVGTDGSPAATAAVMWAVDEADRRNAELVVVHAWDYPYSSELGSPEAFDLTRVDAALVLEDAVAKCRDRGRVPVDGRLVNGAPAKAILEASADAELVVVGSRGRGGFRSLLFGSVAHTVAAHAACPVVVVRAVPQEHSGTRQDAALVRQAG
jgi:nucleotide-binding universal stress UspA family protein